MKVTLTVNGVPRDVDVDPMARLLDVLRLELALTGTKEGCGEGECGACSVLLDGELVCSCLVPACQVDGGEVLTIEGLAAADRLHPLQAHFAADGGTQCGICTPGMILAAWRCVESNPQPTRLQVREAIAGNLCRCTGYQRVVDAVCQAVVEMHGGATE